MSDGQHDDYKPTWRKPAGMALILSVIALWVWFVVTVMEWIGPLPVWASTIAYAIAGIVWIAPLGPILQWMETGRFRAPR